MEGFMSTETRCWPEEWAELHFGGADLGDQRRTRRTIQVAAQMLGRPQGSALLHLRIRVIRAATVRERRPPMATSAPSRSRLGFGATHRQPAVLSVTKQ